MLTAWNISRGCGYGVFYFLRPDITSAEGSLIFHHERRMKGLAGEIVGVHLKRRVNGAEVTDHTASGVPRRVSSYIKIDMCFIKPGIGTCL